MGITKLYFKHLVQIFAGCFATSSGIVIAFGGTMVDYYCAPGAPPIPFINISFVGEPACGIIIAFVSILLMAIGFMVVLLFGAILLDTLNRLGVYGEK
jgi:hypothetical protein